ncbi:InsK [Pantoea sp. Sc1]|nr:InsK [Pantoea sp. Sc1]
MCETMGLSQRCASRLADLSLSASSYSARRPLLMHYYLDASLSWGFCYSLIWQLLRREGFCVNHKLRHFIYCLLKLNFRRKCK